MKVFICLFLFLMVSTGQEIQIVNLPSNETQVKQKGFAGYRCFVKIPEKWRDLTVMMWIDEVSEVDEGYFNGTRLGAHGSLDQFSKPAGKIRRPYIVPEDLIKFGEYNLLAIRILSPSKPPSIKGQVALIAGDEAIYLNGDWQLLEGDDINFRTTFNSGDLKKFINSAKNPAGHEGIQSSKNSKLSKTLEQATSLYEHNTHQNARVFGTPLSPDKALKSLKVEDLEIVLAGHEPDISQPIQVKFDEKGRMWVVQFGQYPEPAGLKTVGMDKYLRRIFDRKLPAPPYGRSKFKGNDKITYHVDKDGDGFFETSNTFVEGLNITTAMEFDKEGIWVLSPPHLLFYDDKDKDGKADSDKPEIHLSGFNLEDTHAVANSLTLGPDGWLYGVTGSTTTGRVKVEQNPQHKIISFMGQTVWRYHRTRKVFELFSEGGYNNFGLDFNERGHLFSGTNKITSILHFVQGGYFRKNLGKHGPHNNYYTYDLLDTLADSSPKRSRLVHQWIPYLGASIPELRGKFIGPNSLSNLVDIYSVNEYGSTYSCKFDKSLVTSSDRWFRPVHITSGPDGALYLSDWYDSRITHLDPRDNWDKKHGRIYRIQKKGGVLPQKINLSALSSQELIQLLGHDDYWFRKTALRLLSERADHSVIPKLEQNIVNSKNALESLWCLYNLKGLSPQTLEVCLNHSDDSVREWGIRLSMDNEQSKMSETNFEKLLKLTQSEQSLYVISQIAASAKRMVPEQGVEVVQNLLLRDDLQKDQRIISQLWWALERIVSTQPHLVEKLITNKTIEKSKVCQVKITEHLGRRLISEPNNENVDLVISMLKNLPAPNRIKFINGLSKGSEGRKYVLDKEILKQLESLLADSKGIDELKIRLFGDSYKQMLLERLILAKSLQEKLKLVESIGYSKDSRFLNEILTAYEGSDEKVRKKLLSLMSAFDSEKVSATVLKGFSKYSKSLGYSAVQLLVSREEWTFQLLTEIKKGNIPKDKITNEIQLIIGNMKSSKVKDLVQEIWVKNNGDTGKEVARVMSILKKGEGDPVKGKVLFTAFCSSCHKLEGSGGFLGPDLSGYELHNLSFTVPAIVNPNLAIREGYELTQLKMNDGLTISGFIKEQNDKTYKVMKLDGTTSVISRKDINNESRVEKSMMPEGLLKALNENQIRDLFSYLKSQSVK